MEKSLDTLSLGIFKLCKWMLIILMIGITLVIGSNIVGRYIFDHSIYWAEEVTRYSFVWATFLGAAVSYRQRGLVSMSVFIQKMRPPTRFKVGLVMDVVIFAFLAIGAVYGSQLTLKVARQTSATLQISMSYVYIILPASCLMMMIFNLSQVVKTLKSGRPLPIWGEDWS